MVLGECQEPIPKRLCRRQSAWPRSGHAETPLLMKTGLLAMATFPEPEPDPAIVRLPTLIVLGRNQTPSWLWLRLRQNQSSWPNRFGQLQSPLLMKTGLLAIARLPVLRSGATNQRPARLRSRCTSRTLPRFPSGGELRTP